ncbi:hypothetical protein ACFC05_32775, partial [Streptomyces hydrogenans]
PSPGRASGGRDPGGPAPEARGPRPRAVGGTPRPRVRATPPAPAAARTPAPRPATGQVPEMRSLCREARRIDAPMGAADLCRSVYGG